MILTTTTKQPCTTTEHNNKGYIFTLYLFMLLCVVGDCLLFYCSCTGNCENCCGINGLLRIANIDQDGKVDGNNILHKAFVNGKKKASVNVSIYRGSTEKDYNDAKKEFLESIALTGETYLSAYVEVGDTARYFIHCKDANSIKASEDYYYGLFDGSEATKIVILSCGKNITDMNGMFYNCSSLKELDLSNFNTENVTYMKAMFYNCNKLTNLDLSSFNTTNVTNMLRMFSNCSSLTKLDLSNFNTTNVTNMLRMFSNCSSLTKLDLSNFNTDKVINMQYMFDQCFKNEATLICKASTIKKITNNKYSWLTITNDNENDEKYKAINKTLNNNLDQVYTCTVKRGVSEHIPQITSVVKYDKAKLFELKNMPANCKINGKQIVRKEFVKLVKYVPIVGNEDYQQMIQGCFMASIALTGQTYLSAYVEVGDTARYFIHCKEANSIHEGVSCYGLFHESEATKIEILSCGSEIKDMSNMFYSCSSLTILDLSKFNTNTVKDMRGMFYKCSSLKALNISIFDTTNVTDMSYMFANCIGLTSLDLSNFNTSNVKYMGSMFYNCSSLTELDLSNFNTNNVTSMSWMFYKCSSLKKLDLSNFNTSNVKYMGNMFYNCSSLTELDLSKFITKKVTNMSNMFSGCSNLTKLDLSKFNTDNVTNMNEMFNNCFQNNATLICTASTIQDITENRLTIKTYTTKHNNPMNEITEESKNSCLLIDRSCLQEGRKDIIKYTVTIEKKTKRPKITGICQYIKRISSTKDLMAKKKIQFANKPLKRRDSYSAKIQALMNQTDKQRRNAFEATIIKKTINKFQEYNNELIRYIIQAINNNTINKYDPNVQTKIKKIIRMMDSDVQLFCVPILSTYNGFGTTINIFAFELDKSYLSRFPKIMYDDVLTFINNNKQTINIENFHIFVEYQYHMLPKEQDCYDTNETDLLFRPHLFLSSGCYQDEIDKDINFKNVKYVLSDDVKTMTNGIYDIFCIHDKGHMSGNCGHVFDINILNLVPNKTYIFYSFVLGSNNETNIPSAAMTIHLIQFTGDKKIFNALEYITNNNGIKTLDEVRDFAQTMEDTVEYNFFNECIK